MEIKPGNIALTFNEAFWVAEELELALDLRRKVQQAHRKVMTPFFVEGYFDLIPEAGQESDPDSGFSITRIQLQMDTKSGMKVAESLYANTPEAVAHPVVVEASEDEVDHLYREAQWCHEYASDVTANFSDFQDEVEEGVTGIGIPALSPDDPFWNDELNKKLETMAATMGIIAAIRCFREQL